MFKSPHVFLKLFHATANRLKGYEDSDLRLVRLHHLAERPNICKREVPRFDLCNDASLDFFVVSRIPNDSIPSAIEAPVGSVGCRLQSDARYRPVRKVVPSVLLSDQLTLLLHVRRIADDFVVNQRLKPVPVPPSASASGQARVW